ncbi:OpgC domain-containing protein [Rhodobacteraceae bacterium HSP-20]|uniref:OpgC domain-containing protein n=1 Tax=Paragemmobacter amnigenus TaxID=2852097 RepID=A0ABS6J357_9RHOB|nr:OpgC domain-containing protein [Rhodobacter amnigenus]MBU9697304.1 OpgC domain-containing protein [Rhodobacter amnigenus]MBV4388531.1 OpgC domain-containing protein [Rhodobacter amnigenus]
MPDATTPAPTLVARATSTRDPRLDVFRGLCLVMIFINHVPGNVYENLTSRNFGFSDAAEGFVLMSGIAAGLAYSADFRDRSLRLWTGLARVWRRVWTLYLVHITTTLAALAAASAVALWLNDSEILFENQMKWVWMDPLRTFVGLTLLTHQFGYINILPLYLVLLAASPLLLFAAWRRPLLLMGASVLLWLCAGIFHLSLPNFPSKGGWFFNPLTWQVIFVTGLLTGVALRDGRRFVPVRRWLQIATGLFLLYAAVSVQVPAVSKMTGYTLWLAKETFHLPWNLTAFDKTFVTAPRLLHILALAYFLSTFPAIRRACAHRLAAPFELLGRQALPVFALGSVLCIGLQGIKHVTGQDLLTDTALIGGGLAAQFALAAARQYWPKPPKVS